MTRDPLVLAQVSGGLGDALLLATLVITGAFLLPFAMAWLEPSKEGVTLPRHRAERRKATAEH